MAVYKQPKSKYWWYKFTWNGEQIRESTKQTNKRVAEQMEAAHRTALAKGEVGIREKQPVGTLADFADHDFLPFVRSTSKDKPNTVRFYENSVANLKAYSKLAKVQLDEITSDIVGSFIAQRQAKRQERRKDKPLETSTINRDLATLRRMLCLAQEWGKVEKLLPKIKLLPGENQRERVLTAQEDTAYLKAASELGVNIEQNYHQALNGVRATVRGKQPIKPDAFQLRDVVTILLDCGLRPEECFRLTPDNIRDGAIWIFRGKRKGSRRRILMTDRVRGFLDMRLSQIDANLWVFPARTKSGHIEASTLRKQHAKALKASGVTRFELYVLRHTCLTRWAKWMDPFTFHRVAGHADMKTTMRYVHPSDADMDEATVKARDAHHGHTSGHTGKTASSTGRTPLPEVTENEEFNGATRRDRTGDLLITNHHNVYPHV
jgi:integrase